MEHVGFRLKFKGIHGGDSGSNATGLHPLLVARDGSTLREKVFVKECSPNDSSKPHFYSVDEFGQRDVILVIKDMDILETPGTVLELDA